jgi:hypothetical protein
VEVQRSGLPLAFNRRLPGDLSSADLRIWIFTLVLSLAAIACLWLAYLRWPLTEIDYGAKTALDRHREIAWPYIAVCALIAICSFGNGIAGVSRSRRARSRREILQAADAKPALIFRKIREIASYVAATAIFTTVFGFENYDVAWIVGLSLLGALALISAISSLRQGDAIYLSGTLLFVIASFLPISDLYNNTQIGINNAAGIVGIILGGLMILAWWLKAPRGILILTATLCILPIVSDFAESETLVGPYVGLVGLGLAILAWIFGAGQLLSETGDTVTLEKFRN